MTKEYNNKIDVKTINQLITTSPTELVSLSELRYFEQLEQVADKIAKNSNQCSILLVSGPSASTKTTTAHKLSTSLGRIGIHSVVISLDNFFVNREDLPSLENGDVDYESISTLDLSTLRACFDDLLQKKQSEFPIFDFSIGRRSKETQHITVSDDTIVIVEGIHALNPIIVQGHDKADFLKLYVSPSSDYYFGDELILSSRNIRFVRRLVRDYFHRSNSIESTMDMWVNVVKSELINIMPYKVEADFTIDTTIMYEPSIYEYYLSKIIKTSELSGFYQNKMDEVLRALCRFHVLPLDIIPESSVLREFLE
ncbi:MAG: hypothetical protein WAX04_12500 [Oscillospiraceae bacterium]